MPSSLPAISIHKQLSLSQGQQGEGVNIRNPSTAILGISSIDRYNIPGGDPSELRAGQNNPSTTQTLSSPYDFSISSNNNLLSGYFTRLAVNEVQFRWTLPTLTSRNNKIYFNLAPLGTSTFSAFSSSGANVTLTVASSIGYSAGQTIVIGGVPSYTTGGVTYNLNGTYTIASTTLSTIVFSAGFPVSYPSSAGTMGIQYLVTLPEGWYNLYNVQTSAGGNQGNLAYQLQATIASLSPTYTSAFTCIYNPVTDTTTQPSPYNAFIAQTNNTSTFYWTRYTDATQPNRVGLFEMMAWLTNQAFAVSQRSSPNSSMLSTPFVDLVCYDLTYNQALKDADTGTTRDILCRLFLTPDAFTGNMANLGSSPILIHRAFAFPKQIKWNADQPIGNLRIQVYDSQGYLLSTGDGLTGTDQSKFYDADMGDFSFTLLVSEV
jgi:hypothetical protein